MWVFEEDPLLSLAIFRSVCPAGENLGCHCSLGQEGSKFPRNVFIFHQGIAPLLGDPGTKCTEDRDQPAPWNLRTLF